MVLRIFLRVIEQTLQASSPGSVSADKSSRACPHIGVVAFIQRLGSSLKEHVDFHVCVVGAVQGDRPMGGAAALCERQNRTRP